MQTRKGNHFDVGIHEQKETLVLCKRTYRRANLMKRHKRKQTLRCKGTQVLAKIDGGVHEKKQTFRFRHTRAYGELEEGTFFRLNKQSDEGQNNGKRD